ncbi:MAG: response regulator [Bacteroidales bacterium]
MESGNFSGKKLLIVEDDFSSRLYLNKILEKTGATILNADNGKEAFDLVMNNPDLNLVLMDIQLPVLDGYTCTKMLREAGKTLVILAQTAYGLTGDKEKILSSGFTDYLIKPISKGQLFDKLAMYLK